MPGYSTGLNLGLRPANERRRYKVTPSLIGWAQTYNQHWSISHEICARFCCALCCLVIQWSPVLTQAIFYAKYFSTYFHNVTKEMRFGVFFMSCNNFIRCHLDPRWNLNQNSNMFLQENVFENVVSEILSILLRHQRVFPRYGDSHVKDKTVARPSYL